MSQHVAFIGLGVMGYPMAGRLQNTGYSVAVYNRTREKSVKWVAEFGGEVRETPAQAAENADLVFACVGRDEDILEITLGPEGAFSRMKPGSVFVDHTTTSAQVARELAQQAQSRGFDFLDAPVSGGQSGAEKGRLSVMVGGEQDALSKAEPAIRVYSRIVRLMGPSGYGQLTKMVNQICIGGIIQGLAEGLNFAVSAGLDPHAVVDVISQGAAQSWQMENRYLNMLEGRFDFGFAVEWMRKDLRIALEEARHIGTSLPLTALVDQFYAEIEKMGGKRWDTSSLIARLKNSAES
ncbi:MAG: NAD(P)-dependent oxidoreductase [SAR324 cluster bacterium]|nr:NAD(P)-dependent oxidoreductase [SAR324 cluster bacterium]